MNIDKYISQQIESQFPSIYREDGPELVELIKHYYEFLETQTNQSIHNARRMFEYRDIDHTLDSMLSFFRNKYLSDIDASTTDTRFLVKNILDLYRRRGSHEGLVLFFKMFYEKDIKVYYPAKDILRPSSSRWEVGAFLQLYPTDPQTLSNLNNKRIFGSISKAEAVVNTIQFMIINSTLVPVIVLNNVRGTFERFDNIYTLENDELIEYGTIYGSLSEIIISNDANSLSKSGNKIGDILSVESVTGKNAKAVVTKVSTSFSGEIIYEVVDGGFGYTRETTDLIVSNQFIFTDNSNLTFKILERIVDQANNTGTIIGQNVVGFGVKADEGSEFTANSSIFTVDRIPNIEIDFSSVTEKNDSSPGLTYPQAVAANTDTSGTVQPDILANPFTFNYFEDIIGNFLNVPLDASDYNDAPALVPMSGNASPIDINTILSEAFYDSPITMGTIVRFINIDPGIDYISDVFAIARDPFIEKAELKNQIITLSIDSNFFLIGAEIEQDGIKGKIISKEGNTVTVMPYNYYGFTEGNFIYGGQTYTAILVEKDYSSISYGSNSIIKTTTDFAIGKIQEAKIVNSGFGFIEDQNLILKNDSGESIVDAVAIIGGQGVKEGAWYSYDSHLNSEKGKVLQDSSFYQEYSYEISSDLRINSYENTLKNVAHIAGTKMFGKFSYGDIKHVSFNVDLDITE